MRKKQFFGVIIIIIVLSLFFGGIVGTYLGAQSQNDEGITYKIRLFMKIIKSVEKNYFKQVELGELLDYAIRGMLRSLDPHTVYLDRDDYNELIVGTKGSFGGLGIQIGIREDVLTIITPIEGTPAYNAGLLAGDKIVEIEGISTKGITLQGAVKKLRGKSGTKVTIGIEREGIKDVTHFTITRDIIKVKAVPYSGMVDEEIGYIRLSTFSETSPDEFVHAIDSLTQEGANKLIIDLRNNSGGLLKAAIEVSDNFIDKGKIIVLTKGRKIGTSKEYYAKKHSKHEEPPLVILVNHGSASASEIFSSAIKDWDRGLILGTKTFGKGSVQQVIPLDRESALKITTAIYYSPSGRSIDTEVNDSKYRKSIGVDKEEEDTTTYYTRRLKRKVYGGGAVTPDVVIESPKISELETKIYQKGLFLTFTVDFTSKHKIEKGFSVDKTMLNSFKNYLRKKKIEFTDKEFDESIEGITFGLKRNIAIKLWGIKGSYESVLMDDRQVTAAIEILEKSETTDDLFSFIEKSKSTE
ncbi:S41 family peptidase [candidate division WOR-3 bacterium]|nr:S41 family peptidase [candidate division WOR-3 bacterium]